MLLAIEGQVRDTVALTSLLAYTAARPLLEQAIACFQALGDDWNRAYALMSLGDVFRDLGIYHEAQLRFEQSMAIYHAIGDSRGYFWIHIKLGEIARDQGEYAAARRWLEPAVAHFTGSRRRGMLGRHYRLTRQLPWLSSDWKFRKPLALCARAL
jgi:tetratricopeptide (TPR) repeat protein